MSSPSSASQTTKADRAELKHLRNEVVRLRERILQLGEMANVCVYGDIATGKLCPYCRCPRKRA